MFKSQLTHWGRVRHICVGNLTIIGSDNGLSPGRRQAIIWTNSGILSIGPLGTNFGDILAEIIPFSFKKMYLKVSSAKWRSFSLGLNVLNRICVAACPLSVVVHFSDYMWCMVWIGITNTPSVMFYTERRTANGILKLLCCIWLPICALIYPPGAMV